MTGRAACVLVVNINDKIREVLWLVILMTGCGW